MDKLFTLLRPTSSYLIFSPFARANSIYALLSKESFPSTHKHVISSFLTCYEENLPQLYFSFRFYSFSLFIKKFLKRVDFTCDLRSFLIASWTNRPPPLFPILLFHQFCQGPQSLMPFILLNSVVSSQPSHHSPLSSI